MEVKRKLSEFLKRETVLTVAILLAIVSAVMIPPDREYAGYIDFRTLSILFCLMTVMAGLQKLGVFRNIAKTLLRHTQNTIQLAEVLVLLCFIFSMIITNDVSLITFVPFTFIVLRLTGEEAVKKEIFTSGIFAVICVVSADCGSYDSLSGDIGNCGIGGSPFRSWYSYKSGLFAFADVCGLLYFYRKYGKNACFL